MKPQESTRRVRLRYTHLTIENGTALISGLTENGRRYEIVLVDFDEDSAQCAVTKCGAFIAEKIRAQRQHHRFLRERLAAAWSATNAAIEEPKP